MAENLPTLSELLARPAPPMGTAGRTSGILGPGISAGIDTFQALSGRGIQAVGDFVGSQTVADIGAGIAERNFAEAARNGRQDLESFPTNDLTKAPAWLGYQVAKQIPNLALTALAYRFGGPVAARYAPQEAVALASRAPTWLGGGGLRAGMTAAEAAAANTTGARLAAGVLAQAPINYPQAVGSMYNEALESGNAGPGTAALSLLGGVPYSLAEGFQPAVLGKMVAKSAGKGALKEIATGALTNAAQETLTEGAQTAMEQAFRPDLPLRDRMANVVEGALTGGLVGGVFGGGASGIGAMRSMRKANPSEVADTDLAGTVDEALGQMDLFGSNQQPPVARTAEQAQQELADIQQRTMLDNQRQSSAFVSSFMPDNAVERAADPMDIVRSQLLQQELARQDGTLQEPPAPVFTDGVTRQYENFPLVGEGPFRETDVRMPVAPQVNELQALQQRVADGTATAQDIVRARILEQGPTETSTSRDQFSLDLLNQDGTIMERQMAPRAAAQVELPPADEQTVAARKTASELFGSANKWVSSWVESNIDGNDTPVTMTRKVMDAIDQRDEAGKPLRKELIAAGAKLGLMDAEGKPIDLVAQYTQLRGQTDAAWSKAQQTGLAQDVKRAQDIQKKAKALEGQVQLIEQARAVQMAPPPAAVGPAPVKQDVPVIPKSAPKSAAAFEDPKNQLKMVVRQDDTFTPERIQKQQLAASLQPDGTALRGSLTAFTDQPVQLPKTFLSKLPVAPKATKGMGKNAPITVTVNHRGEAYVTSGDVAKINERTTPVNIEWMNGAERTNTPWAPNNLYENVWNNTRPANVPRDSASSPENIAALNKARVQRERLARIAKSDMVSSELKNAAGEALTALETFQPGASDIADRVLADASERTMTFAEGDIGDVPPGSEKLAAAAESFKTVDQAADWIIANTNSRFNRIVARLIKPVLENATFRVVKVGDVVPADVGARLNRGALGLYLSDFTAGTRELYVRQDRLTEGLVLHELIHAATNTRLLEGNLNKNKGTPLHDATQRFYDLQKAVADAYNKMAKAGTNPELTNDVRIRAMAGSVYELMTYGFTDEKAQNWLRTIPYKSSNMFTRFVEVVRDLLGIGKNETNALAELIDISEQLLAVPFDGKQSEFDEADRAAMSWSPERLDREMRMSHYSDGRSKAWVAWVDPSQFLDATATNGPGVREAISAGSEYYDDMANIIGNEQTPFLIVQGSRVVGHEGRHRMSALVRKGVTSVPITVIDREGGRKRSPIASMTYGPQGTSTGNVTMTDMIPLQESYRATIEERMQDNAGGRQMTFALATPEGMVESAKNMMGTAANIKNAAMRSNTAQEASLQMNRFHLFTSTLGNIVDYFGKLFLDANGNNVLAKYYDAHTKRNVVDQRLAHLTKRAYAMYETLLNSGTKGADQAAKIGKLMGYSFFEIDPRKTWDQHTWLQKKANEAELRKHVADANRIYSEMKQAHGIATKADKNAVTAMRTYDNFILVNETFHLAQQAVSLYNLMVSDGRVSQATKSQLQSPMDLFLQDALTYDDPAASKAFWLNQANELAKQAKNYMSVAPTTGATADDTKDMKASVEAINARVQSMEAEQRGMEQAPYFHLGRFGNYALSFNVKLGTDNRISDANMQRVAKAFADAGITGIEIPVGAEKSKAFLRFEQVSKWNDAQAVAQKLQKQGLLEDVQHFSREQMDNALEGNFKDAPKWMERLRNEIQSRTFGEQFMGAIGADEIVGKMNTEFKRHIQQYMIDMLPDTSINKVMVHREYVPGFDSDMVRSFLFRAQVGGRALANLYASGPMADATTEMTGIINESKRGADPKQTLIRQNVARELFKREAGRPVTPPNRFIDALRSFNHAYFLGLSPAHAAVNMTQIPVILWPELSKKYGFAKSARALAKVTPEALRIVKATVGDAMKLGLKHIPDATITKEALAAAGVTGKTAEFVLAMNNMGTFDIGSQTREIARMTEGRGDSKLEMGLRFASITGYYTEMVSRLIAALAARELHGGDDVSARNYAAETVRQSMFSYDTYNQARATGRMGLAGEFTPVMTSFMQYTYMLTEKLYREVYDSIKGDTPKQRKAARAFLASHLAAIVTLTGTLGMPMAAVFAAVFDGLANTFGDDDEEPWNIQASYRNLLSDVFGQGVGEVIAKGVPRAFGVDIAQRAGEQNLLPYAHAFTRLLTDRRDWEDKSKEWALDTLGSPVSMITSIIGGGMKIASGDLLQGGQEMLPLALRGPVKAFRMAEDGSYIDGKGKKLPMPTPGAGAVLAQALGFNPSRSAEYTEARATQASYRGDMVKAASRLRDRLVDAMDSGDRGALSDLLAEARQFDLKNPDFQVMKTFPQAYRARKRAEMTARMYDAPTGVKPSLAEQTRFANTD